jgi:hypothetical protein
MILHGNYSCARCVHYIYIHQIMRVLSAADWECCSELNNNNTNNTHTHTPVSGVLFEVVMWFDKCNHRLVLLLIFTLTSKTTAVLEFMFGSNDLLRVQFWCQVAEYVTKLR